MQSANKGAGENSYAMNSLVQRKIISLTNPAIEKAIMQILNSTSWPIKKMEIADLGCSSGPNVLEVIWEIIDAIHTTSCIINRPSPTELMLYMNDLFTNDFNNIFASLPSFLKKLRQQTKNNEFCSNYFVSAVPGTFYGRLFPTKTLHFVYSSSSLHWLSQVPRDLKDERGRWLNKGKLYISKSSPKCVLKVYSQQFQNDFSQFLEPRSQEMVDGGRMVLSLMGRESMDPTSAHCCYQWELLAKALMTMVSECLVEEEKVDSFNAPYYAPCVEELRIVIEKEGSFMLDSHEAYEIDWDDGTELQSENVLETMSRGERVAKTIRAVVESMLKYHFGSHIIDELFQRYAKFVEDYLSKTRTKYINLVISLVKQQ